MKTLLSGLFLVLFSAVESFSQQIIELKNPSFEDIPRKGSADSFPIRGWSDCGEYQFPSESPPDILPTPPNGITGPAWGVTKKAFDGQSYVSLVTRFNASYESISQQVSHPLQPGKCYQIRVHLALAPKYKSVTSRSPDAPENFSNPVQFVIWGGNKTCEKIQVLASSGDITIHDWNEFVLVFSPDQAFEYISIGAYWKSGYVEPYNGHVLVDAISPITEIGCD